MSRAHSHSLANFDRAFIIGILLNSGFVATEAVFGFFAHSLALLADAGPQLRRRLGAGDGLDSQLSR
jgi:cobalt-zinc-cadmium efflux system protein